MKNIIVLSVLALVLAGCSPKEETAPVEIPAPSDGIPTPAPVEAPVGPPLEAPTVPVEQAPVEKPAVPVGGQTPAVP